MRTLSKQNRLILGIAVLGASLTACSTTGSMKTSSANPAPITYKVGKPELARQDYAALTPQATPKALPYVAPSAPAYTPPKPVSQGFDSSSVDTDLYMHQKVGRPYTIEGKRYTPKHDPSYDETGIASWYGPNFHGKLTANGETYDKNGLTAAHKTLPLNSNVFVTNLENGKTLMVRLNDRGPFVDGRIIDLSAGAAQYLGVTGLAKVRVQYAGPADMGDKAYAKAAPMIPAPEPKLEAPLPAPKIAAPLIPAPEATPKQMVEATPQNLPYQPLSVVPHSGSDLRVPAPQTTALQEPEPAKPVYAAPNPPYAPQADGFKAPRQTFTPPANGGVMTMTITGPIHLASNGDNGYTYADLIDQGGQYVQAATFSTLNRAKSVKHTLEAAGPVTIHEIKRGEATLHKVLVGPYDSQVSAQNALSLIATLGYGDAKLVNVH